MISRECDSLGGTTGIYRDGTFILYLNSFFFYYVLLFNARIARKKLFLKLHFKSCCKVQWFVFNFLLCLFFVFEKSEILFYRDFKMCFFDPRDFLTLLP